jgi:hypothetical protein
MNHAVMDAAELALGTYVAVSLGRCLADLSVVERRHAVIDLLEDLELRADRSCDCGDCSAAERPSAAAVSTGWELGASRRASCRSAFVGGGAGRTPTRAEQFASAEP